MWTVGLRRRRFLVHLLRFLNSKPHTGPVPDQKLDHSLRESVDATAFRRAIGTWAQNKEDGEGWRAWFLKVFIEIFLLRLVINASGTLQSKET